MLILYFIAWLICRAACRTWNVLSDINPNELD